MVGCQGYGCGCGWSGKWVVQVYECVMSDGGCGQTVGVTMPVLLFFSFFSDLVPYERSSSEGEF